MPDRQTHHEAVVVGAGFGGLGAAIQLKRLGIDDLLVVDRESDVGGTWHVNRYPGLAVDIPSAVYSYSFEPNPAWSRLFAPGEEIRAYARHVADAYDLRRHLRLGTVVDGARWDDAGRRWVVRTGDGGSVTARYLVTATGFLSMPKIPDIDGIESFRGRVVHTSAWDDGYDLTGRRAAVIGTGATAVQLIPAIADRLAELTVYQRTPIWVSPKPDLPLPRPVRALFARAPGTQRAVRRAGARLLEALMVAGVVRFDEHERANRVGTALCLRHLRRQVEDPVLRAELTPDYTFGCKRPTYSNTYYRAFTKEHVHLETTPISHVEADGVVTADGRKTVIDALLLATGFDLWDANFPAFEVVGRDGRDLGAWWRGNRFQAYQGITMPGFPNLFSLTSPFAYAGLSYFTTIESQMSHLERLLTEVRRRGATGFEVRAEANDAFLDRMTRRTAGSVFVVGNCATANSYYFNPHGEATLLRPTSTANAFREHATFPLDDYAYA